MKFIVQHNLINEQHLLKINNVIKHYPHQYISVIPFSHELISDEELSGVDYIPYGSTLLTNIIYESYHWRGLHFDLDRFNYEAALKHRNDMLNGKFVLTVPQAIDFFKRNSGDWFIRPSQDLKQFTGHVVSADTASDWLQDALECASSGTYKLSEDTIVIVDEPKTLMVEWRWFIVGGKIISGSVYRIRNYLQSSIELDADIIKEAQQLADEWLPNDCCVMDTTVVKTPLGYETKVVEFNCINASGFYDNDIPSVFKSLYEYHTRT